jgi:hypothetical protein
MGDLCTVSYGVGGVFYRLVPSSNSQVSYQLIWKLTLLLLCLLSTTTTTSTTAKKKRRSDIIHYFTTIDGVIHNVAYGRSFDWFFLNLVSVDLHNIILSITSPIIMTGIYDYLINQSIDDYGLCYSYYSNIHESYYDYHSSLDLIYDALAPRSFPSLEPRLKSSLSMSSIHAAATDINVKSHFKDYYYRCSNVYDDSPSKAIIFSSCHNLRLPVGMEIFILLLTAHSSEPSAVPSSVPSAIPSMEPSLKPSTTPISAPNELTILFLTALTFAETSFTSTVQSSVSITVPSLEPSLISTTVRSSPIQISLSSSIPSLEPRSLPSSTTSLEPSSLSSSIPSLESSRCPGLSPSSIFKLEPIYIQSSVH